MKKYKVLNTINKKSFVADEALLNKLNFTGMSHIKITEIKPKRKSQHKKFSNLYKGVLK